MTRIAEINFKGAETLYINMEGQRARVWKRNQHPGHLWQEPCLRARFYFKTAGVGAGKERLTTKISGLNRMEFSNKQIVDCEGTVETWILKSSMAV